MFKEDGVIHAGNASQISDGASALLIMSEEAAAKYGLTPIAKIHTATVVGADPVIMLTAPIPATAKALEKSGLSVDDIGVFEVNEAFAPVPLAWLKEIGADPERSIPTAVRSPSATRSVDPVDESSPTWFITCVATRFATDSKRCARVADKPTPRSSNSSRTEKGNRR